MMRLILDVSGGSDFFMLKNFEDEGTTIRRNVRGSFAQRQIVTSQDTWYSDNMCTRT